MSVTVRTSEKSYPITLEEVKVFLRVDNVLSEDEEQIEDQLISTLIEMAFDEAENRTHRILSPSVFEIRSDNGFCSTETIKIVPCKSVTVISNEEDITPLYTVKDLVQDYDSDRLVSVQWNMENKMEVPFPAKIIVQAGHETVPAPVKTWILHKIAELYETRGSVLVGPNIRRLEREFVDCLLDTYIIHGDF